MPSSFKNPSKQPATGLYSSRGLHNNSSIPPSLLPSDHIPAASHYPDPIPLPYQKQNDTHFPPRLSHSPALSLCCLARRTTYMLAPHLAPLDDHHAAAPPALVPRLAAPAAVPPPVARLVGAGHQRALGHREGAHVRRRRVRDCPGDDVGAGPAGGRREGGGVG